jgi:hypothetical protein
VEGAPVKSAALLASGVVLGYLVARVLREPSGCHKFVAAATRDKVATELGETAARLGDLIGWDWAPGVVLALPQEWTI